MLKSNRGYRDWLIQRTSAIVIGVYAIFVTIFFIIHQPIMFYDWQGLFANWAMKLATFVVLVSILYHAWIGMWTVFTDYIKNGALSIFLQALLLLLLLAYLAVGIEVLAKVL